MEITIQKANLENLDSIKSLMIATFGPFDKIDELFQKWITDDQFSVQVALVDDQLVGVCTWGIKSGNEMPKYEVFGKAATDCIRDKKVAFILNLAVKSEFRRNGLGKKLSLAHYGWLKKQNCDVIVGSSWVHGTEDNSQHLFLKNGFKILGESKDYYRIQMQHGGTCSICKTPNCNCNSILFGIDFNTLDSMMRHDEKYKSARAKGLPGWGGVERVSNLPQILDERYYSFKNTPTSGKLLELGCGAGNLSIELSNRGFDVTGVDFSDTAIEWAKDNAKSNTKFINFRVADVTNLNSFVSEYFDVLYDGNCLHCIIGNKRVLAIAEWKRLLKPGGILFISSLCSAQYDPMFPKDFDPASRILSESGEPYRYIPTPETIESELQNAGFEILTSVVRKDRPFGHINIHALKA